MIDKIGNTVLILFLPLYIACNMLPPAKTFTSQAYAIDWESRCVVVQIDGEFETRCYSDDDKLESIVGIDIEDLANEISYQDELIKSCSKWR